MSGQIQTELHVKHLSRGYIQITVSAIDFVRMSHKSDRHVMGLLRQSDRHVMRLLRQGVDT